MPANPSKKRLNQRGDATRDRILDAAEQLFAECGFDGASMRDISAAAQAELGSIGYHFHSKDDIYTKVLERRNASSCGVLLTALDQMLEQIKQPTVEDILKVFTDVVFDTFRSGKKGEMYWARLMMQRIPVENNGRMHSAVAKDYLPVRQRYTKALSKAMPTVPMAKIDWCFSLFELSFGSSLFSSTQKSFALQRISAPKLQELQISHIEFFAAGLRQIEVLFRNPAAKTAQRQASAAKRKSA
jgi:AcrR family transcriptional regulator